MSTIHQFIREQGAETGDNIILPFAAERLQARGRIVRLGSQVDTILRRHDYPEAVSRLLGEAIALGILLGASLKFDGRFILQTQTDGPVPMLVVDFETPDRVRAWAQHDTEALAALPDKLQNDSRALLGNGHLALTIEHGGQTNRYQGLVPLEDATLAEAADMYFAQSEQIPTLVRLAVAEHLAGDIRRWRAGGLLVQYLPEAGIAVAHRDLDPGDAPDGAVTPQFEEDDHWVEARALAATIEDHEMIDPDLSSEELLYRLFHEKGVRVFQPTRLQEKCRCTEDSVAEMLRNFSSEDRKDMIVDGEIFVVCQFCSTRYDFSSDSFD